MGRESEDEDAVDSRSELTYLREADDGCVYSVNPVTDKGREGQTHCSVHPGPRSTSPSSSHSSSPLYFSFASCMPFCSLRADNPPLLLCLPVLSFPSHNTSSSSSLPLTIPQTAAEVIWIQGTMSMPYRVEVGRSCDDVPG
jgi:hypothetical protein